MIVGQGTRIRSAALQSGVSRPRRRRRSREELESEVERLISLGAKRVDWVYGEGAAHVVLADTEGNFFCVVDISA
jgi:hypothetical protein